MAGEQTRAAVFAQPEWLRAVPTDVRLPEEARVVYTGCGTSFHAAQTAGRSVHALEAAMAPPEADILVVVSHSATTYVSIEAGKEFEQGERWIVTARQPPVVTEEGEFFDLRNWFRVVEATPREEDSWCHTASYTCAVAALAAMRGEDVSWLPDAAAAALREPPPRVSEHDRWLIAGAGATWPTAQEAAVKLREGAFVAAEAHHTEQLLHGHLAAVDERVRAFVFDGPSFIGKRARDAVAALRVLGCETTLLPTVHPVLDIIPFHLLLLELAELRGVDPDRIRRDDERWARARATYT
jgi:glucosamine--fructose-6-phosphate aminotransferase (isomerizing)